MLARDAHAVVYVYHPDKPGFDYFADRFGPKMLGLKNVLLFQLVGETDAIRDYAVPAALQGSEALPFSYLLKYVLDCFST